MTSTNRALPWLLEDNDPSVRYVSLRDLTEMPCDNDELVAARKAAYTIGEIARVLKHMNEAGYWEREGAGYNPKYRSGVWSLILLSQLGASLHDDPRIAQACTYYLDHAWTRDHSFSCNGTPSETIYCLEGNMCLALTLLGCADERLFQSYEWMAKAVLGEGVIYYSYLCGPGFACGINAKKPCGWGAVKTTYALGMIPEHLRTPRITRALKASAEFLLSTDPLKAEYPMRIETKPNRGWWKFGFPVFYMTDILQTAEAVVAAGYGDDKRLRGVLDYIRSKQDSEGRWLMEYDYTGKT